MTSKKLFKKDNRGFVTTFDLYSDYAGYSVLQFNKIKTKMLFADVSFSIYQWRDGLEKPLDKLSFSDFKRKYVDEETLLHFDPMSKVYLKVDGYEADEFTFELSYELDVREHEPVYL
jgi:hypothetical protein